MGGWRRTRSSGAPCKQAGAMSQHRDMGHSALFFASHSSISRPLTEIFWPLVNDAASEGRKTSASAAQTRLLRQTLQCPIIQPLLDEVPRHWPTFGGPIRVGRVHCGYTFLEILAPGFLPHQSTNDKPSGWGAALLDLRLSREFTTG
jgi:hypothetical protein